MKTSIILILTTILFQPLCLTAASSVKLRFQKQSNAPYPTRWKFRDPGKIRTLLKMKTEADTFSIKIGKKAKFSQVFIFQAVPVVPRSLGSFTIQTKVDVKDCSGDYGVLVMLYFIRDNGKWHSMMKPKAFARNSSKWRSAKVIPKKGFQSMTISFAVPSDAVKIGIRLEQAGPGLSVEWKNPTLKLENPGTIKAVLDSITPPQKFKAEPGSVVANGMSLKVDWSNRDASKKNSLKRHDICLNGLWAFAPTGSKKEKIVISDAFIKIPGNVRDLSKGNEFNVLYGNSSKYRLDGTGLRWVFRRVMVPKNFQGHITALRFDLLKNLSVKFFLNGKSVAVCDDRWGGDFVLPSKFIHYGQENTLALLVLPHNDDNLNALYYGDGTKRHYHPIAKRAVATIGDISLKSKPLDFVLDSVRITPDYRNSSLKVSFTCMDSRNLHYDCLIKDKNSHVLLKKTRLKAIRNGSREVLDFQYSDPLLWFPDSPELSYCIITARSTDGKIVDQTVPIRFGFREVWNDGKKLFINGQELRLRPRMSFPYSPQMDLSMLCRYMQFCKKMGFNTLLRISNMQKLEDSWNGRTAVDLADEMGIFIIAYTPYSIISGGQFLNDKKDVKIRQLLPFIDKKLVSRYYNNPSVIAYSGFGSYPHLGNQTTYVHSANIWGVKPIDNARKIEELVSKKIISNELTKNCMLGSINYVRGVKNLDQSRPFLSHNDAGSGDGWGAFDYFNWLPRQEWEEWIVPWTKNGVKPIGTWEHGFPFPMSFVNHAIPDGDREPWLTEHCASILGRKAYELEEDFHLDIIRNSYNAMTKNYGKKYYACGFAFRHKAVQALWSKINESLYRAWRSSGFNLGIEPFGNARNYMTKELLQKGNGSFIANNKTNLKTYGMHSDFYRTKRIWPAETMFQADVNTTAFTSDGLLPLGKALYKTNRAFLGSIRGPKKNPFEKTHIYRPGETINKQICLVYDNFQSIDIQVKCSAFLNGKKLADLDKKFTFKGSAIQNVPFEFKIPKKRYSSKNSSENGVISACFYDNNGKEIGRDSFPFSVINPSMPDKAGIILYDSRHTAGEATVFAEKIITKLPFNGNVSIVIIAPGAFSPEVLKNLPERVPILVLPQSVDTLESIAFRVVPARLRNFFADSSLCLDDELLRDWRAGAPLNPQKDSFLPIRKGYISISSTTGMVAETVLETPTRGNFTPLIHGGFDLAYTPALLTYIDEHPVLFCQLNLPPNAMSDSGATATMTRIINILKDAKPPQEEIVVLGNVCLLKQLGWNSTQKYPEKSCRRFWVESISEKKAIADLKKAVKNGAVAIVLPQKNQEIYSAFNVTPSRKSISFSKENINGLNAGNFHFRQKLNVILLENRLIYSKKTGKGKVVFVGFNPEFLDLEKKPYLKLTWRRMMRSLAQILTNENVLLHESEQILKKHFTAKKVFLNLEKISKKVVISNTFNAGKDWFEIHPASKDWKPFLLSMQNTYKPDAVVRVIFDLPEKILKRKDLILDAGSFDDYDIIYLNGEKVGKSTPATVSSPDDAWKIRRKYIIPTNLLKKQGNVLAIRVWNRNGLSKNWPARIRGPLAIISSEKAGSIYAGKYRHCDDPYLIYHW